MKPLVERGDFGKSGQSTGTLRSLHQPVQGKETGKTAAFHSCFLNCDPEFLRGGGEAGVWQKGLSLICDASQTLARLVTEQDEAAERGKWPPRYCLHTLAAAQHCDPNQGLGFSSLPGQDHLENFNTEVGCRSVG